MRVEFVKYVLSILVIGFFLGCGSAQPEVSQDEILEKHVLLKDFYAQLEEAKKNEVDFYAPRTYKESYAFYEQSFKLVKNNEVNASMPIVAEGLVSLQQSQTNAQDAKKLLQDITQLRDSLVSLGLTSAYTARFEEADSLFQKANRAIENGDIEEANAFKPKIAALYNSIRSDILKDELRAMTQESSEYAKQNKSDTWAPKTMAKADAELATALQIVTDNPDTMDEAKVHANLAILTYKKATQMNNMVEHFKSKDYNEEDYILWYWAQLESLNKHLDNKIDFTTNNYQITENINAATAALIVSLQQSKEQLKELKASSSAELFAQEKRYDELNARFNNKIVSLKLKKQKQKETYKDKEKQYTFINSLFNTQDEATIYKEKENIVISAFGIDFQRNKSVIPPSEYSVLTKIVSAIKQYPNAKIGVYGHTDSIGEATPNMNLSVQRAKNVTKFLVEIGHINAKNITTKGYGEVKPVATNMIKAGRRQNSRIEIHILLAK